MLIDFFFTLKDAKIPVTIKEFLTLLEAMEKNVIGPSMDDFYYVARLTMVKDEANFDKFDRAFAHYFKGVNAAFDSTSGIPLDWLIKRMERELAEKHELLRVTLLSIGDAVITTDARGLVTFGRAVKLAGIQPE